MPCVHFYRINLAPASALPVQVVVELPRHKTVPAWLRWYIKLAKVDANWSKPSVSIPSLEYFDFKEWRLHLPYIPSVSLDSLIGTLPLHFVVRECGCDYVRIVVQRYARCHLLHPSPPTILMHEYEDIARRFMVSA